MAGSSNSSFNLGGISAEKFKEFNGQEPDTEDQYHDWSQVGRNGRVLSTNNSPVNTPARAEISNFKDTYNRGLRRSWFETMKVMERACLDDAYTLAAQCPKTALIQIPIGWNGSPNDIMTSIRVSLARVKVKIDDVVKTLDPLVGGDFRLTAKECQTLFSITFKDLEKKAAVLKLGSMPWFKKDAEYSKKGELKIIDLARREITMEVSHYEPELNEQYDKALTDLYTEKCGPGVTVKIEEGIKEETVSLGPDGNIVGPSYTGKKYVRISFPTGAPLKGLIDGKLRLKLGFVYGERDVYARQIGKKYSCQTCGGWECERFYCMSRCIYCRRELNSGEHVQSMCQDRGLTTNQHILKTKDLERVAKQYYMPAVRVNGTDEEYQKDLQERDGLAWKKIEKKVNSTIEFNMKEAKGKAFGGDTPYEPMSLTPRKSYNKRKNDQSNINQRLLQSLQPNKGGKDDLIIEPAIKKPAIPRDIASGESSNIVVKASDVGKDASEAEAIKKTAIPGDSAGGESSITVVNSSDVGKASSEADEGANVFTALTQPNQTTGPELCEQPQVESTEVMEVVSPDPGDIRINLDAASEHSLHINTSDTLSSAPAT